MRSYKAKKLARPKIQSVMQMLRGDDSAEELHDEEEDERESDFEALDRFAKQWADSENTGPLI
jgi:hypothetical protein